MLKSLISPKLLLLITALAVIPLLAACGGEEEETTTAAPAPPPAPAPAPAPAPTPEPEPTEVVMEEMEMIPVQAGFTRVTPPELEEPTIPDVELEAEQTMKWYATGVFPPSSAPYRECCNGWSFYWWVFMPPFVYAPGADEDYAKAQLREGFARAYDVSDDSKTYTIHINPEAVFTNGKPVTAADVKQAWEFGAWPANQVTWGGILRALRQVEGIDEVEAGDELEASGLVAVDDHTLQINLKEPNHLFHLELTTVTLGMYDVQYAQDNADDWQEHPVGVGPYQMTWDPTSGDIELVEADNPWPVVPFIKKVEMPFLQDPQANLIAYEAGDADRISARQPAVKDPSHPLHGDQKEHGGGGGWYWGIDATLAPTDDVNVRMALNHALDMDAIAEAIWGTGTKRPKGLNVSPSLACYNESNEGYTFDPEKAKEYLAQSKYADDLPTIAITSRNFMPEMQSFMELAQAGWKEVLGIDVRIDLIEQGNPLPPPDQIKQSSFGATIPDPAFLLRDLTLSDLSTVQGRQGPREDDELDQAMRQALALPYSDPGRCAAMQRAEELFMSRYYWIPWSISPNFDSLAQPWVLGWKSTWRGMNASLPFMRVGKRDRALYN